MKTPKFQHSFNEVSKCVNRESLLRAWKKKLGAQLRSQVVFDLIEYRDFDIQIQSHIDRLLREIEGANYSPRRPVHYLVEKSRGLCRQMTLSHPRDMLVLQALSSSLQIDLKRSAPTDRAFFEPGAGRFHKRKLLLAGEEYGAVASWKRFQKAILEFSRDRQYVVVADVANFYDFINFRHLRNIVASHCNVKESALDFLIYILNELSWTPDFMPRIEVGLPQMELEAPRVLANAMLFELDKVAMDHSLGDYVRFMDDIDVGVDSIVAAKKVVKDIDLTLQARQLRLNSSKTKILSSKKGEVSHHFCAKENFLLDSIAERLERGSFDPDVEKARLSRLYLKWRGGEVGSHIPDSSRFFQGNGEKIFKRIVKLKSFLGLKVDGSDLLWLVKNRPSLRGFSLAALTHSDQPNTALYSVADIVSSGLIVDDAAFLEIAKFVVHAKLRDTAKLRGAARALISEVRKQNGYFGLYSGLIMASKIMEPAEINSLLEEDVAVWAEDFWLGRLIGGLAPSFLDDGGEHAKFLQRLRAVDNADALAVYGFHSEIWTKESAAHRHLKYVRSENHSYPRGIIHSKAMIARSLKHNDAVAGIWGDILRVQSALVGDPFYRSWALR